MATGIYITELQLMNVDFGNDYQNVIDFNSLTDQSAYFKNTVKYRFEYTDISVIRNFEEIRLQGSYTNIQKCNYCRFVTNDENIEKTYYAFITSVRWAGVGVTSISIEIDVWQTYLFEHELDECFVERGHVNRKLANGNPDFTYCRTLENFNVGSVYENDLKKVLQRDVRETLASERIMYFWVISTESVSALGSIDVNKTVYGTHLPFYIYVIPFLPMYPDRSIKYIDVATTANYITFNEAVRLVKGNLKIYKLFLTSIMPSNVTKIRQSDNWVVTVDGFSTTFNAAGAATLYPDGFTLDKAQKGYTENFSVNFEEEVKLSCYPYRYFRIVSDRGNELIARPEFTGTNMNIFYSMSFSPNFKQGYGLKNYLGDYRQNMVVNSNVNEFPQTTDAYLQYIQTSNASMQAGLVSNFVQNGVNAVSSALTGNFGQALASIGSSALYAYNLNAKLEDLQNTPDQIKKPGNNWLFELTNDSLNVAIYETKIPTVEMNRLCRYFQSFGYSIKDYIKYNTKSRKRFNYVKTVNAIVNGEFNIEHRNKIAGIYDNGVRIWHYASDWSGIGDTSIPNPEV